MLTPRSPKSLQKLCRTYLLCGYEAPSLTQSQEASLSDQAITASPEPLIGG